MEPPHDLDSEAAVIAALLEEGEGLKAYRIISSFLAMEHFYSEAHRRIFEAASEVFLSGRSLDLATVTNQLVTKNRLAQVGGREFMNDVAMASPDFRNVRAHAEIVFDMWRRRQAIVKCQEVEAKLYHGAVGGHELQTFLDTESRGMLALANKNPRATGEDMKTILKRVLHAGAMAVKNAIENKGMTVGATTSLDALDEMCGGMLPGKKFTIAALPGRGKSVLGLQIARVNAERGIGSVMFATEQTNDELAVRLLASTAEVDSKRVMRFMHFPTLDDAEWHRVVAAGQRNAKLPLVLESDHRMTVDDIVTKATTMHQTFMQVHGVPLGVVVVDYLQRLARPVHMAATTNKSEIIGYNTARLKTLAQDIGVVVVELAQQSFVKKDGKILPPAEGMIDYSRDCERESDGVVYLQDLGDGAFQGVVTKVREGGTAGTFPIDFQKPFSRMVA